MKIKFMPQNIEVEGTADKSLLQIATENKIEIRSICKGVPSCAECRVRIIEGEGACLAPSPAELSLIGSSYYLDGRRLSCQVHCYGPVTVDLTEQLEKAETSSKKIRGFKSQKPMESRAIQDTMILTDKTDDRPEPRAPDSSNRGEGQGPREPNQRRAENAGPRNQNQQRQNDNRGPRNPNQQNRSERSGPKEPGQQPRTDKPRPPKN